MAQPRGGIARPVPEGSLLLRDVGCLATLNEQLGDIRDAAIYIERNVITWVGSTADLPAEHAASAGAVLSLPGHVVIPGMVNTHHHMYQTLTRCVAEDSKLFDWLTALYPTWARLTGEDAYNSARCAMAELVLTGCTTSSDHLYVYPNDVMLDDTIRAAREVGLRFHPTRGAMSKGQSNGGLPPDEVVEYDEEATLKDMERCISEYHDAGRYSMMRVGLAPCSPFSVTDTLMKKAADLARTYPKVRLHTHLAENQEDIEYSQQAFGCRPGEYIKRVGWDRADCWFAHCCMLDHEERSLFAQRGIGIAHCPSSNLRLASGIAPVRALLDEGVNVGLGVDGSASNDGGNMIGEARLALLLQRSSGDPVGLRVREALELAIKGGARNLGREDDLGELAPGFAADLVAWRTDTLPLAGARADYISALLLCTPGNVDLAVINGEVVVRDGKLLTCDLQDIIARQNASADRLMAECKK